MSETKEADGLDVVERWFAAVPHPRPGWRHAVLLPPGPLRAALQHRTAEAGGEVVDAGAGADAARCLAALERAGVTHLSAPAATLARLAAHPAAPLTDLDTVLVVVAIGPGTAAPEELRPAFPAAVLHQVAAAQRGPVDVAAVVEAAAAAGAVTLDGPTHTGSVEFVRLLDRAVLGSMLAALQGGGALTRPDRGWTAEEVLVACGVAAAHHGLIRRWLAALADAGLLTRHADGLRGQPVDPVELAGAWDAAERSWTGRLGSAAFVDYLRRNAERLGDLMTGRTAAVTLLFADGRSDVADAVYRDTATARYLNAAIAAAVARIDPARVLEVGAGTAATTETVLARLGADAEYLFTDVSRYFLDAARARFAGDGRLSYAVLDIDRPATEQGIGPGPVDVVVAAGVLNAARDVDATVRGLARLLVPGGFLLVSEPTREHLEILASQAFMMAAPVDVRARAGTSFLTRDQWHAVFTAAGLDPVATLPEADDHPLAPLGQRLFVVRAPLDRSTPHGDAPSATAAASTATGSGRCS